MPTISGRMAHVLSTRLGPIARAFSRSHVERYRSSDGTKSAEFRGRPVFLLDVVGRRSGEPRPVMLMLVRHGDALLVAGSNGGNPDTPNWYRNLMAAGVAHVEVEGERWPVTARQVEGDERAELWEVLVAGYPDFTSYQELTDRQIPVAILEPTT